MIDALESVAYYPDYITKRPRGYANVVWNGTFFMTTRTKIMAFTLEKLGSDIVAYKEFQFKLGQTARAMAVYQDSLFILLDNTKELKVLNLKSGKLIKTFTLPGDTKGWEGIAMKQSTTGEHLRVFLAHDSLGQVWEFHLTMRDGFKPCA